MTAEDLAHALHRTKCASHRMGTCTGGHLHLYRTDAKQILTAPDPATALHASICDADMDPSLIYTPGCGPDRARHIEHLRKQLDYLAAQQQRQGRLDIEGEAA